MFCRNDSGLWKCVSHQQSCLSCFHCHWMWLSAVLLKQTDYYCASKWKCFTSFCKIKQHLDLHVMWRKTSLLSCNVHTTQYITALWMCLILMTYTCKLTGQHVPLVDLICEKLNIHKLNSTFTWLQMYQFSLFELYVSKQFMKHELGRYSVCNESYIFLRVKLLNWEETIYFDIYVLGFVSWLIYYYIQPIIVQIVNS